MSTFYKIIINILDYKLIYDLRVTKRNTMSYLLASYK